MFVLYLFKSSCFLAILFFMAAADYLIRNLPGLPASFNQTQYAGFVLK